MKDSFIFYKSFYDAAAQAPNEAEREDILWYLVEVCLGVKEIEDIPFPASAVAVQALASVESAKRRYDKSVEDGKKGGRPRRWVDRAEAEKLFAKLGTWTKVAEALEVSDDTLYRARMRWKRDAAKPQNPNVYVSDYVSVSESDSVSDSDIRNNNSNPSQTAGGADAPPPAPEEKMEWFTEGVNYGPPDWEPEPPE